MYQSLATFAQTWGLIYFMLFFAGVLVYVMWPRNRQKFRDAAQIPLQDDADDAGGPSHV